MLEDNNLTIDANFDFADGELRRAAYHNDLPQVEKLLSEGIDVNDKNEPDKRTALHYAAMNNVDESHFDVIDILLKNNAEVGAQDNYNRTPFWYLVTNGNAKILQLFLDFNADVHEVDNDRDSLLSQVACFNNNVDVVPLLISLGLDVNHRSNFGKVPLHWTCYSRLENIKMIRCLLRNGADMNSVDNSEATPLLRALEGVFLHRDVDINLMKRSLNFIMEHSDLNLVHNKIVLELFILGFDETTDLWKTILEHLAKLQSLEVPMHPALLASITRKKTYHDYYVKCQEELSRAKGAKLTNSWVNHYHLIMNGRRRLKNLAGNRKLIEDFKKSDCVKTFPVYGPTMIEHVNKGIKRRELFDEASEVLSDCLPIFDPTHLVVYDILNCILSKKDLLKLSELSEI